MIAVFAAVLGMASAPSAHAATKVPPGNRNVEQPAVPGGSAKRTAALKTTYEAKYKRVVALLRGDEKLRRKIIQTARRFSLDPIHMIGAIVGERGIVQRVKEFHQRSGEMGVSREGCPDVALGPGDPDLL